MVTAVLRNEGAVNVNDVTALLEWTDVGGTQYLEFDPSFGDNDNPKQWGVLFPQQSRQFRWGLRMSRMNTGPTPLTVQLTLRYGAASIPTTGGDSLCTATVTILPLQSAPIIVLGNNPACDGDTVVLDAGNGYASYRWSTQDTSRQLVVTQSGSYHVRRVMGTEPYCMVLSDTVQMTFHPKPDVPVITRNGNTLSSTAAATYQWVRNGGAIPLATSQDYTATANGVYFVIVTNGFGCTALSDTLRVTLVSVDEPLAGKFTVDVYPNPSHDVFTLSCTAGSRQHLRLTVRDILGRVVLEQSIEHNGVYTLQRVDLSALPDGIFYLRLENATVQHTRVLLLQRE